MKTTERGQSNEESTKTEYTRTYRYLVIRMISGTVCSTESTAQHRTARQGRRHGTARHRTALLSYS